MHCNILALIDEETRRKKLEEYDAGHDGDVMLGREDDEESNNFTNPTLFFASVVVWRYIG